MKDDLTVKNEERANDPIDRVALLRILILIRRFEEKCVELYSAGEIRGFLHLYIGEEAVAAGLIPLLRPEDRIVSTYREHGHALVRGIPASAIMAEMFGKVTGCSRGRGGSMHLFDASRNFYGGNAIVGGGLPLAVGLALADKMQDRSAITGCFLGDGAVAEGEFHESMNLASIWELPVLFICENNLYAMGTALSRYQSQPEIAQKADGYNIKSATVDGMDVLAVEQAAKNAIEFVRSTGKPFFLVAETYRFRAHSMYDPELYRAKEEVEEWKKRCPIDALKAVMLKGGEIDDAKLDEMEKSISAEIEEAVAFAESSKLEAIEDSMKDVHTPMS